MLIRGATVHDGRGTCRQEDVLVRAGTIAQVGANLVPQEGEETLEAAGQHLLPGFVWALSNWGVMGSMTEIRPSSQDNEELSELVTPELEAFYAFNGRACTAQQLAAFGITCVGVAPTENTIFGGRISAFEVDGVDPYAMCVSRDLGMMASVCGEMKRMHKAKGGAPQTRMYLYKEFAEQLRLASVYERKDDAPRDDKMCQLRRVIEGELPLFVACDSAASVAHVRDIVAAYPKLRLVLVNGFGLSGEEAWLADGSTPLVVHSASFPLDKEAMELSWAAVARAVQAGAVVALSGQRSTSIQAREDLLWNAYELLRELPDSEAVLPCVTSAPARILGLADRLGSVEAGKRADLVLWSADPFATTDAHVVRALSAGRTIYREGDEKTCLV